MNMWTDLGEFIANQCIDQFKIQGKIPNPQCKVVEIAIGKFFEVSDYLSSCDNIDFISTDIRPGRDDVVFDDITNPNMDLYDNAKIIYSIRPPQELQPYIGNIAKEIGAKLIIKPLFNEDLTVNFNMNIVNYKKAFFYQGHFIKKI